MMQVPLEALMQLTGDQKAPSRPKLPRHIDIKCSKCGRDLVGNQISWQANLTAGVCWSAAVRCNGCRQTHLIQLFSWPAKPDQQLSGHEQCFVFPSRGPGTLFNEYITEISPQFVEIWRQACEAESRGLNEVCGPGFRKALEFLVKDYLIWKANGDGPGDVASKPLGACIRDVVDEAIIPQAERAAWLGNDQVHYERKHTNHGVEDLKTFVGVVVSEVTKQGHLAKLTQQVQRR